MVTNYPAGGFSNLGPTPKGYSSLQPVNIQQKAQQNLASLNKPSGVSNTIDGLINSGVNAVKNYLSTPATQTTKTPYSSSTYTAPGYISPSSLGYSPSLTPPSNQDIKSHTDSNGVTQTYYPKTSGLLNNKDSSKINENKTSKTNDAGITQDNQTPKTFNVLDKTTGLYSSGSNAPTNGTNTSGSDLTDGQTTQQNNNPIISENKQAVPNLGSAATNLSNTAAGNAAIGQNAADITSEYAKQYNQIGQQGENSALGYESGQLSPIGQGNALAILNTTANKQKELEGAGQLALTGTGQQLTAQNQEANAYNQVGGLVSPQMQFGQLTNVTGNNAGSPINGGAYGSNPQLQAAVSQAVQLAQKAGPNDPSVQALLSTFGMPGQVLFNQAMQQQSGGSYNPATMSTQVATNNANITKAQTESVDTGKALQQIDAITPVLTTFLSQSGMNPYDAQLYNGPVNDYISKIGGSGKAAQWAAQMGDLKNYTSQLISSGYGGTPTGAEASTLAQDPSKLSYKDLTSYLQTLKDLGGNRKAVLDSTIQQLGGSSGYTGNQTSTVTSTTPATPGVTGYGTGITTPGGQATAGVGLGVGSWAINSASKLGGEIMGYIAKGLIK